MAIEKIYEKNLSCAIFAPGWVLECNDENKFIEVNQKFWGLLKDQIKKRNISSLPVVSTFTHSRGEFFYSGGSLISLSEWCNLNLQSLMPSFNKSDSDVLSWCFNDAFYGGSCLMVKSSKNEINLFELDINIEEKMLLKFEFTFKIEGYNYYKNSNNFRLSFKYYQVDSPDQVLHFDSSKQNDDHFELVESLEQTNNYKWHSVTYLIKAMKNIQLISLVAMNNVDQKDVKLGKIFTLNHNFLNNLIDNCNCLKFC